MNKMTCEKCKQEFEEPDQTENKLVNLLIEYIVSGHHVPILCPNCRKKDKVKTYKK